MISHAKISCHRRMFKMLTGLSTEGFKQMLPSFEKVWKDTGFQDYEPAGFTTLKPKKKPKGGKLSPEEKGPIGVSPRYGCASSTVAPESKSSVASVKFIATSRLALRTPSSKPPADCTISGAASPSRPG